MIKRLLLVGIWVALGIALAMHVTGKPLGIADYFLVVIHVTLPNLLFLRRMRAVVRHLKDRLSESTYHVENLQREVAELASLHYEVEQLRRMRKPAGEFDRFNNDLTIKIDGDLADHFKLKTGNEG